MFNSIVASSNNDILRLCSSRSTNVDDVIFRTDLHSFLQSQRESHEGMSAILSFVDQYFPELIFAAFHTLPQTKSDISSVGRGDSSGGPPLSPKVTCTNATELIAFYLSFSQERRIRVIDTVSAVISLFENTNTMPPLVSLCFQRLLLVAFEVNPGVTAEVIASTLSERLIEGAIRNIATSFIVAETVMAVFGSALTAQEIVSPRIKTHLFTECWILWNFPQRYASYIETALRSRDHQAYFYFFKEILKRGFSHTAGPVADVLLKYEVVAELVKTVIESCEEAQINSNAIPFASQGVEILYSIISLVRHSLIPPDGKCMYGVNVLLNAPVKSLCMYAERFCNLLTGETSVVLPCTDAMRITVCELFVEILRFNMKFTDQIVMQHLFLEKLLLIACKYPDSNRLCILLQQSILSLFSNDRNIEESIILQHIISRGRPPNRGFLSDCVSICTSELLSQTLLSAVLIESCGNLINTPLFKTFTGPLWHVMESFLSNPVTQRRMKNMAEPITGAGFSAPCSGCHDKILHRPTINHAGKAHREITRSFYAPEVCLAPTALPNAGSKGNGGGERNTIDEWSAGSLVLNDVSSNATFCKINEIPRDEEDTVTVEYECEVFYDELSPQVRAYPKFTEMTMSFKARDDANHEDQFELYAHAN